MAVLSRSPVSPRVAGVWLLVWAWVFSARPVQAQSVRAEEYEVKAAFLFNFAQFVEWPRAAFRESDSPLVIGVLGNDPFGQFLDETVRGERIGSRGIEIRRFRNPAEIQDCHVLFISRSEASRVKDVLGSVKGRALLTVSDVDNFPRLGGMIGMGTDRNRVRLFVNVQAATAANLTISSKLLRAATIVPSSGGRS